MLKLLRKINGAPSAIREGVVDRELAVGRDGIAAIVHEPAGRTRPSPAVVWIHGGGMISGSARNVNAWASGFAADLDALVIAPDYRLAPENPYPAAIDDCFDALRWLVEHAEELGVDPSRIAVGGESAGGGLAAALAQRAHDAGIPLRLQVLVSPMLDDRTVTRAESDGTVTLAWTVPSNRFGWAAYLDGEPGAQTVPPYAAAARRDDLSGLAPAWIMVGTVDLFHQETVEYATRLKQAGVPTELVTIPGAHHAAEVVKPAHPAVADARARRLAALRSALTV
ncbi:alpha/beta hydrolase [Tessaracoccus palaemonis]|uniref:Alpha/beta hydrolase n=1 Tax=Tessaracoccus palaemonis TaxID=2829499 RepID=A0ABX8SKH7_9ACTN|nr:alpha/beta hydrolase [Tessaracoccus palaemonis]QXT63474.1 alpha/beta hydrolase [Tessaracoccus palaemonis]